MSKRPSETLCNNGVDNDCDGLIDGEDPDCGPPVDCSQFLDRNSRRAEATCRWGDKNKVCVQT